MTKDKSKAKPRSQPEPSEPRKDNAGSKQNLETSASHDSDFTASISGCTSESGLSGDISSTVMFMLDTPPTTPILKNSRPHSQHNSQNMKESIISSISVHMSALYAMLVVILGAVIQISNPFSSDNMPALFQGFYIYLFIGSISFLLFLYICVLRTKSCSLICKKKETNKPEFRVKLMRNFSFTDSTEVHAGSFYLRLGAVAFGIGSMIMSGLAFGNYFECNAEQNYDKFIYGVRPVVQFVFTFGQLYFVFLHSKICVHSYKIISRFGFMHMIATNLCVWLGNVVDETLHEIHESETHNSLHETAHRKEHQNALRREYLAPPDGEYHSSSPPGLHRAVRDVKNTSHAHVSNMSSTAHTETLLKQYYRREGMMGSVVEEASPYLYPCSIEYSLICAAVLYIMWSNIGRTAISDRVDLALAKAKAQRMSVDCTSSNKGFFLGILFMVASIINVITFFILIESENGTYAAMILEYVFEIIIYVVTSVAVVMAFYEMRGLQFIPGVKMDLEQNLIILALAGIYIFSLLSIIAGSFLPGQTQSLLIIISSVLRMFQATIQTVFMLNSLRRCAHLKEQERKKPGREFVTFLLMVNIGMWIINSFEVQQTEANPVQIGFYGVLPWNIFAHISSPLAIFYRFHSTVCLSNVWKHAWKRKRACTFLSDKASGHGRDM